MFIVRMHPEYISRNCTLEHMTGRIPTCGYSCKVSGCVVLNDVYSILKYLIK